MSLTRRPALVLLLGIVAALAVAVPSSGAEDSICTPTSGPVEMKVDPVPDQVSPTTEAVASYTNLEVRIENCGPSTKNAAQLDIGMAVTGTPTGAPQPCQLLTDRLCSIGTLRPGVVHVLGFTLLAPSVTGPVAHDAVLRYGDEGTNPNEPESGVQKLTRRYEFGVGVAAGDASTWVRPDVGATLFSSKEGQTALVEVPAGQSQGFAAELKRDSDTPFTCAKKAVCRTGAWFVASINDGAEIAGGLTHTLTWPASQVDRRQTERNLVVWHMLDSGRLVELRACGSAVIDCVVDVDLRPDRSLTAVVRTTTNGRMR